MRTFIAMLGTFLEWAEYSFYGYLASKMSRIFFPQFDQKIAMIATFGVFAAGFIARPLGGIVFGYAGDVLGRKKALSVSIVLMGLATLSIGLLPTYQQVGLLAPILLLSCRMLQGIAVSGEFNGASIYLIEHAKPDKQYLAGSSVAAAAAAGMLFGAMVIATISLPFMPSWSWRIPFFIGAFSCIAGYYLRQNLTESPQFLQSAAKKKLARLPIVEVMLNHKKALLQTGILAAFVGIYVYICNIYYGSYLIHQAHYSMHNAVLLCGFGQAMVAVLIPIFANKADKVGGKKILLPGLLLAIIVAPLMFLFASYQSLSWLIFAEILYAIANAATSATIFKTVFDLFPTNSRYTGITFAWSLSVAIFGGTAPLFAQYLLGHLGFIGPAIIVSCSAILALCSVVVFELKNVKMVAGMP